MINPRLKQTFIDLPLEQKIELVEAIWDSISQNLESVKITKDEKEVLDTRLDSYQKNSVEGTDWGTLKDSLLKNG